MSNSRVLLVAWLCALSACPPPAGASSGGSGGGRGGGGLAIDPDACGPIDANPAGRKLYAFLQASADLDRASIELEGSIHEACRKMAIELGTSTEGTTKDVCHRAAVELDANLKISVTTQKRLVTRYQPPQCHTELDFAAKVVAQCEARASADVDIRCQGRCNGTCNGACSGGTATGGVCNGTCEGSCSGGCDGYADVKASAECKASGEVRANLHTECSEPKIEVVQQDVTIVDDSKFKKAMAAINVGLPPILRSAKRLELAARTVAVWATTGASLVRASGELLGQVGDKAVCVGLQLAAVAGATANIQARFEVSIEVSAQVTASAGAQPQ